MIPVLHTPDDELIQDTTVIIALLASLDANAAWIEANPDAAELPRTVGEHEFTIGGKKGKGMIRSLPRVITRAAGSRLPEVMAIHWPTSAPVVTAIKTPAWPPCADGTTTATY